MRIKTAKHSFNLKLSENLISKIYRFINYCFKGASNDSNYTAMNVRMIGGEGG